MSNTLSEKKVGAWLSWPVVVALLQLQLNFCPRWQVYLAVLLTSARYGGQDAKLGIDDLCDLTGLSPRTVKSAVSALCKSGLLVRVRRSRLLRVPLLHSVISGITLHKSHFTRKQDITIASLLDEIRDLCGIDGLSLIIPVEFAVRLGFNTPTSYAQAYKKLKSTGTRGPAGIFVEAILPLYNSHSIQGKELR